MMEPWWRTLLREQQRAGFADLAGASASVVLPISDRLLTQLAAERMPPNWVSEITVHAEPGEQFSVRVRLAKLSFLPSIRVRLRIHRQPAFPAAPVLVLRLVTEGIAALGAPLLRLVQGGLPPGVRLEGELIAIDLPVLLRRSGASAALDLLTALRVRTETGRTWIDIEARLPAGSDAPVDARA